MRPLHRKLLRDVLAMRGQALAIGLVIAAGVAMCVMYLSTFDSLQRTADRYYAQQRFADVFVSLVRAPLAVASEVAALPGVAVAEPRVVVDVTLDVEGMAAPAAGRLVSIPADRRPQLNDLYLRQGRWIEPGRPDEVIASEAFCRAHGLEPGARVGAIVNGRRRTLTIVGIALSPEFVYTLRPGALIPDDRTFGIFWMAGEALASAFDLDGAFNDLVIDLARDASVDAVIADVDRVLEPYGGLGALPREQQPSNWILQNEFAQLRSFGVAVPVIFLAVAAFVLNVALTRAVAMQRAQIATLKAVGYSNGAIARHYLGWAVVIASIGIALGVAAGAWLGGLIVQVYNDYFRFPVLDFRLSGGVALLAGGGSLLAVALGAWTAVRRAARIPPAEAMRPEAPTRFRHSLLEARLVRPLLSTTARMVLRNLERQPMRTATSVVGMACAVAILAVGFAMLESMTHLIDTIFGFGQRHDVAVTFVEPRAAQAVHAIQRLPGVLQVETFRAVGARVRAGHRERTVSWQGRDVDAQLNRIVSLDRRAQSLPPGGLVLSTALARALEVEPGATVQVDVLEGRRDSFLLPVAATVDDALGLSAYMERGAMHRLLRESAIVSGAYLLVDDAEAARLSAELKTTPAVADVAFVGDALRNFREIMAQNLWITIVMNVGFAGIIAFGVVYNAARISLAERSRELASMRVLGFTRREVSAILLGELAVLTIASIVPGILFGHALGDVIETAFSSEVVRFTVDVSGRMSAWAALTVMAASTLSALVVRRRVDHLDMVAVLKAGE